MTNDQITDAVTVTDTEKLAARQDLLCRVVDVESALLQAFRRFVEEQKSSLEDMMNLSREELSKMELFAPQFDESEQG